MSVAAEGGLVVWGGQIEVQVSCQVFDPHRRVLWEQSLTVGQLLLQVANIQLQTEQSGRDKQHVMCV